MNLLKKFLVRYSLDADSYHHYIIKIADHNFDMGDFDEFYTELPIDWTNGKKSFNIIEEKCTKCDGTGWGECPECGGDGELESSEECEECEGTGTDPNDPDESCKECDGEGTVEVHFECPRCNGEGTKEEECDECDGKGYESKWEYNYSGIYEDEIKEFIEMTGIKTIIDELNF